MLPQISTPTQANPKHDVRHRLLRVREHLQHLCECLDSEIRQLDNAEEHLHSAVSSRPPLFDHPPQDFHHGSLRTAEEVCLPHPGTVILESATPSPIEPGVEEETLDELNAALNRAFNEITRRAA